MPGFSAALGAFKNADLAAEAADSCRMTVYHSWHRTLPPFIHPEFRLFQAYDESAPAACGCAGQAGVRVWVDGDVYNLEGLHQFIGGDKKCFCGMLSHAIDRDLLECLLQKADGEFTAFVFDEQRSRLTVVCDRFGLRPLYYYSRGGFIFFCSELKGMLAFSGFAPAIRKEAAECFLALGHLVGGLTWFDGVSLLPPASITEFSTSEAGLVRQSIYWGWGQISRSRISFEDAVVEMGEVLQRSVRSRIKPGESVGLPLSGGLDSRAILAALPEGVCRGVFTFGKPGCRDIRYASMAASEAGVPHTVYELRSDNWLSGRFHALWKTDGMACLFDLHASQFMSRVREVCPVNLNGFSGDLIAGGSYLKKTIREARIDAASAFSVYGRFYEFDPPGSSFYNTPHGDPYIIMNRVRRLVNAGIRESSDFVEQRKPFMSNEMIQLAYSVPDSFREGGRLYHAALMKKFRPLFCRIPWQQTGLPVSVPDTGLRKLFMKAQRVPIRLGLRPDTRQFHDYARWINEPGPAAAALSILHHPGALFPDVLGTNPLQAGPERRPARGSAERLGRLLTLEVWLQQVINKKYRTPDCLQA